MLAAVSPFAIAASLLPWPLSRAPSPKHFCAAMTNAAHLRRAYVNNGGDIALHLAPSQLTPSVWSSVPENPSLFGTIQIHAADPIRGIATSGWRGRSFSLGIADAVTVLANPPPRPTPPPPSSPTLSTFPGTPHSCGSQPAKSPQTRILALVSSLDVSAHSHAQEISEALERGAAVAEQLRAQGLIHAAALCFQRVRCEQPRQHMQAPLELAVVELNHAIGACHSCLKLKSASAPITVEEIFHEGGPVAPTPLRRAAALAVIHNPFSGKYNEEISGFMEDLKPLGLQMANSLVTALGGDPKIVEGYGKGAIVGQAGELEHGALWHVPGGYAMREILGGAKAIVASTKKVGGPGTRLDVPITHINASYVRSHFDSMEVGIPDAPRADEILLALVMATGPRIHARVGGLKASEIKGEDGLR